MPEVLHLIGAYGRDATLTDWEEGKDFKIYEGPYTSKRDLQYMRAHGVHFVVIENRRGETISVIDLHTGII
jgi:hypothetical protein